MPAPHRAAIIASPASLVFAGQPGRPPGCVCVLGSARGGTSMIAQMLVRLGVFMGDGLDPSTGEDPAFLRHQGDRALFQDPARAAGRAAYLAHARAVAAGRTRSGRLWGFKDPLASHYLGDMLDVLPQPALVVVLRDAAAIGQREVLSREEASATLIGHALAAAAQQLDLLQALERWRRPALVVSYERALRAPRQLAQMLADFAGLPASPEYLDWASDFVMADRGSGEVQTLPDGAYRAAQLGRGPELHMLLRESVEFAAQPECDHGMDDDALIRAATDALHRGAAPEARMLGFALLRRHGQGHAGLGDGLLGAIAGPATGGPAAAVLPDHACYALYLIGLANIHARAGHEALAYLRAAEAAMRARLLLRGHEESWISLTNYWPALYHLAWVARWLKRDDLLAEVLACFARAGSDPIAARLGDCGRDSHAARAVAELT